MASLIQTRRDFLKVVAASGAAATVLPLPIACHRSPGPMRATFFTEEERTALAAIADYILPPDQDPGAAELGAVEYIERLMTAFEADAPQIFAGGPYSGRQPFPGADGKPSASFPKNEFATFLPLDRVQLAAWRLRLYGSNGVPGGGPNDAVLGPVVGLRDTMRSGLRQALEDAPGPIDKLDADQLKALWVSLPKEFRDAALPLIVEAALSAPEYGGNKDLAGWRVAHFEGDAAPLGYSLFDATAGTYRERPDAPISTANPGADPDPIGEDSIRIINAIIGGLDGRMFS
jgi:gluconate 2-dehydrogenase subunit 3-like protein